MVDFSKINLLMYLFNYSKGLHIFYSVLWVKLAQCYQIVGKEAFTMQNGLPGMDALEPV